MQKKKVPQGPKNGGKAKPKNGNGNGNGRANGNGGLPRSVPVARPKYSREFPSKPPVSGAVAYAAGQSSSAPRITASRDSARIIHKELVAKVTGTANFTVGTTIALNPGLASSFPWLSTQAAAWETYRFNKLRFCYHTRTATSATGSVQLVPDYDAADAAPASEFIAASYEDMQEDAPWKDLDCVLRPDAMFPMGPKKFVRTEALSANQDIKTFDAGNLFVCTTDGSAQTWGLVWVEYDVSLYTPQQPSSGFAASQHITASVPTSAAMLPSGVISAGSTTFVNVPVAEVIAFQSAGRFLVEYHATATTSVTQTAAPTISSGGGSLVTTFGLGGTGNFVAGSGTTSFSSSTVLDAVLGTNLTFNHTIVDGLLAELIITRLPPTQV
jgi:hypothetical protein